MTMTRCRVWQAPYFIATRQAFDAGNLYASYMRHMPISHGELSDVEWVKMDRAIRARLPEATYVVYSYLTPIAWVTEDEDPLYVPDVRYSVTTSRHQGKCRAWGGRPGSYTPYQLQWLQRGTR